MAALLPAGIAAAGSIIGGITGGKGAKRAAKIQQQATAQQIAAINANRDYQYSLNAPSINRGTAADDRIGALLNLGGDTASAQAGFDAYRGSTGYDFRLNQGLGAVNQNQFAGGAGQSGATLRRLMQYGQGLGSAEFGNYLQQLGGVSAGGANARSLVANVGDNTTNQFLGANQTLADARGDAAQIQSNNLTQSLQNLFNIGANAFGSSYKGY